MSNQGSVDPRLVFDKSLELQTFSLVLDDVGHTVPGRELGEKEARTLSSLIQACRDILADTNMMLQNFKNLDTSSTSSGARTQKAWKGLMWDPHEVNELRSLVTSNTVSLDAFNSSLVSKTFQAVEDNLNELTKRQDQQELQAIINRLPHSNSLHNRMTPSADGKKEPGNG